MKFKMNDVEYTIKEVSQQEFWDYQVDEQDGYYYGQSHFQTQEVWIDKDLPIEKKKTLYHELTHVYIREYLTSRDIKPDEEVLCDISANSHDIIHKIVEDYFKYYIQGSDHYLIPKDVFNELFVEMENWREDTNKYKEVIVMKKYQRLQGKEWHKVKNSFRLLYTYKNDNGNIKGIYTNGKIKIVHWLNDEEKTDYLKGVKGSDE